MIIEHIFIIIKNLWDIDRSRSKCIFIIYDKSVLFIQEALKHDASNEAFERFEATPEQLSSGFLETKLRSLPANVVIALCSKCLLEDLSGTRAAQV